MKESSTGPKVLISRLSAHGDVIQTLPLLGTIRAKHPDCFIGWVVEASAAPLLENHPLIDRLHVSQRKRWFRRLLNPLQWPIVAQEVLAFLRGLRTEKYDISLDVQGLFKSAVIPFLAGIPQRLGYADTREGAAVFYTRTLPYHDLKNPEIPAVVKFMEFAEALGALVPYQTPDDWLPAVSFPLPPVSAETRQRVQALLKGLSADYPTVAIAPATIWPSKHWRPEHWTTLLAALQRNNAGEQKINILLLGGPEDVPLINALIASAENSGPIINLTGKTSLTDLYELFRHVDLFIGLDSAPLHIANAVASANNNRPTIIGLYGPTGPRRTGPIGEGHMTLSTQLDCQPCFEKTCPFQHHDCMKTLQPEHILEAAMAKLQAIRSNNPTEVVS